MIQLKPYEIARFKTLAYDESVENIDWKFRI